jgi:hypothetical protein
MPYKDPDRRREYSRAWYARNGSQSERQIYALLGPDRKPRYVGMSVNAKARALAHWQQRGWRRTNLAQWLRTLPEQPELWLIQTVPAEQGRDAEVYWIKLLAQIPGLELLNVHRGRRRPVLGVGVARGEANGSSRLTDDDIRAIRSSTGSCRATGERYGVSHNAISLIRQRKTWTHVE